MRGGERESDFIGVFIATWGFCFRILLNHWQYFYKGGVLRKLKATNGAEDLQHQERFMAMMRLYGHALVAGNDPHIMGIVLESLQRLDEQWKLYHKEVFQTHLLAQFQYALIGALVSPEGALCYDQMIGTLYTMGQVNMKRLHEAFYMFGFSADNKLVQEICLATVSGGRGGGTGSEGARSGLLILIVF